jgi:hypothetical protein
MNLTPTTPVATPPIINENIIERVREGTIDLSEYVVEAPKARYHSEYQQEEDDDDE